MLGQHFGATLPAMKFATIAAALLSLAHGFTKEEYDSGVVMAKMMAAKEVGVFGPRSSGYRVR